MTAIEVRFAPTVIPPEVGAVTLTVTFGPEAPDGPLCAADPPSQAAVWPLLPLVALHVGGEALLSIVQDAAVPPFWLPLMEHVHAAFVLEPLVGADPDPESSISPVLLVRELTLRTLMGGAVKIKLGGTILPMQVSVVPLALHAACAGEAPKSPSGRMETKSQAAMAARVAALLPIAPTRLESPAAMGAWANARQRRLCKIR